MSDEIFEEFKKNAREYVAKPVVIKAVRLRKQIKISTEDGVMTGKRGDWLIQGTQGEFYPCTPVVFFKKYSKILNEAEQAEWEKNEKEAKRFLLHSRPSIS